MTTTTDPTSPTSPGAASSPSPGAASLLSPEAALLPSPDEASPPSPHAQVIRRLVAVILLSVAIGSLLLAVPGLRGIASQIAHLHAGWVLAAVAAELGSCVAFVVVFRCFFERVPASLARKLAWLEQGAGALLPGGGVGALAVGGWVLRREGISTRQIIERSSALFFFTSAVNVAALVGAGGLLATALLPGPHDALRAALPVAGGLAATGAVLLLPLLLRRLPIQAAWLSHLADGIAGARLSLRRPSWRLIGALGYLALDIGALGATFAATGHPLPVAPLVLGYLIGYLANLIPVPGGFGVLEGGLAGALIAYGAPPTQAAAAVVVYHAIAFWVPSLGGVLGFALLRRRSRPAPRMRRPAPGALGAEPACC